MFLSRPHRYAYIFNKIMFITIFNAHARGV